MTTATNGHPQAPAPPTTSFGAVCPDCGVEGAITCDLNDLDLCTCSECSSEFSPAYAIERLGERLAKWRAVARWFDQAAALLAE